MATRKQILPKALKLPIAERAELAGDLIRSLDEADGEAAKAWILELERRANDVFSGKAKTESWTKVRKRLEAKLRARQA
jgi:putative addiction module component (TIGR02574 family)